MRLEDMRRSDNVEDARNSSGIGRSGAGIGVGTILLMVVGYFLGINPSTLMNVAEVTQSVTSGNAGGGGTVTTGKPTDAAGDFAAAVLGETENVWGRVFAARGARYTPPTMRLFRDGEVSACGEASAASGPFYCPGDQKVYIDLAFFDQLATEFGAAGDFARAYVIAHEVGHHVQTLLGTSDKIQRIRSSSSEVVANRAQVAMELQADCYAGIWAKQDDSALHNLEAGDLEEALRAAAAVGDDTIQRRVQGRVVPESFTHGTAEQRAGWFKRGFEGGTLESCDTFGS
jgi:predicted metalloprotease